MSRYDVVVLGGGFAGSLLGRCMAAEGARVLLLEKAEHPRFALGESTTPLANFALERLAARYGFDDLDSLAAWGRWTRDLPHLRCGLKRGFTFYDHRIDQPWRGEPGNGNRALFAASPDDDVADSHWLRADVDLHLLRAAEEAGVEVVEGADVTDLDIGGDPRGGAPGRDVDCAWSRRGARHRATADRVVDATGAAGLVARRLRLPGPQPLPFRTALVSAHVDALPAFRDVAGSSGGPGADRLDPPYPEERAAIHHLLAEGWIYSLPFDHGPVSVGAVLRTDRVDEEAWSRHPRRIFAALVGRYPSLAEQFCDAQAVEPWTLRTDLPFRRTTAAGDRWLLLPGAYAFYDPLFSTGIAWSLLGVERARDVLCGEASAERYGRQLAREADQMARLVEAAWLALDAPAATRFDDFMAVALCYFGAVSWSESVARLSHSDGQPLDGTWDGFLGAGDQVLERLFAEVLAGLRSDEPRPAGALRREVVSRLEPRDVAGLDQPPSPNVFPLDLDLLVRRAGKMGLDGETVRSRLERLRR